MTDRYNYDELDSRISRLVASEDAHRLTVERRFAAVWEEISRLHDAIGGLSTDLRMHAAGRELPDEDEPEPEEYDPGPEVDDEGGMSEIRRQIADDIHGWPMGGGA